MWKISIYINNKLRNLHKYPFTEHFQLILAYISFREEGKRSIRKLTVFTICSIESRNAVALIAIDKVCTSSVILTKTLKAIIDHCNSKYTFIRHYM